MIDAPLTRFSPFQPAHRPGAEIRARTRRCSGPSSAGWGPILRLRCIIPASLCLPLSLLSHAQHFCLPRVDYALLRWHRALVPEGRTRHGFCGTMEKASISCVTIKGTGPGLTGQRDAPPIKQCRIPPLRASIGLAGHEAGNWDT